MNRNAQRVAQASDAVAAWRRHAPLFTSSSSNLAPFLPLPRLDSFLPSSSLLSLIFPSVEDVCVLRSTLMDAWPPKFGLELALSSVTSGRITPAAHVEQSSWPRGSIARICSSLPAA
eukprot:2562172-Pleurochrysis_carterae.AAC.4